VGSSQAARRSRAGDAPLQDAADLDETCKIAIEELRAVGMSRRQQKNVKSGLLAGLKDKRRTK
jgi:hypothetical protein